MSDDNYELAGTRRRAIVAKALRQGQPDRPLQDLFADARAVLDALDEGDEVAYSMTAEQQIREGALRCAATLLAPASADSLDSRDVAELAIALWLLAAEECAQFIDTGYRAHAEPTPPLNGDAVAEGAVS
ncbi:MAG: hypothetical protein V4510_12025 [bacterium]